MYKNKYSSTGNKNVFFTTLADATNRYDPVSDETYKVSAQVYADSINEWLEKPMTKEHDSYYADNKAPIKGEILDSFMNTEGYVDQNGVEHEATYLPTVCCYYNDSDFEKRKGVSNTFEIIDSEIEERDAGMEKVRIVKKIRPISLAVLFNQEPAFRACDVVNNSNEGKVQKIISMPVEKKLVFKENGITTNIVNDVLMENVIEERLKNIEAKIDNFNIKNNASVNGKDDKFIVENANNLGISDADYAKIRAEMNRMLNEYRAEVSKALNKYREEIAKLQATISEMRRNTTNKSNSDDDVGGDVNDNTDGDDDKKDDDKKDNSKCGKKGNSDDDKKDDDKKDNGDDEDDDDKNNNDDDSDKDDKDDKDDNKKENAFFISNFEVSDMTKDFLKNGGSF